MYRIGKLSIDIIHIFKDQFLSRLVPFYMEEGCPDITYDFCYSPRIMIPDHCRALYEDFGSLVVEHENRILQIRIADGVPYAVTERLDSRRFLVTVPEDIRDYDLHHYVLPDLLHLEQPLIEKANVVLHSSYIYVPSLEGAVLFTAPSGGGKSTQADLWENYADARIINGDKCILGKEKGIWNAYGTPFSGASPYCLNETHPVKGVVILDKGPVNRLIEAGTAGVACLLSQITVNPWDQTFCEKVMDLLAELCMDVLVYYYSCTKTAGAVETLYRELRKRREEHGTFQSYHRKTDEAGND